MESSFCCYRLPAAASRCPAPQFLPGLSVELSSMNLSNLFLHVFICVTSITSQGNEFCSMVMCSMELYPGLFLISHLINFWAVHFFLYFLKENSIVSSSLSPLNSCFYKTFSFLFQTEKLFISLYSMETLLICPVDKLSDPLFLQNLQFSMHLCLFLVCSFK